MHARTSALQKQISNLRARTARKLENQRKELEATYDRESLRQKGDLVTANLHNITRGQTMLETENFYDPDLAMIRIPLSPTLSPQKNAAKYYKGLCKAKTAESVLTKQIAKGEVELDYLSQCPGRAQPRGIRAGCERNPAGADRGRLPAPAAAEERQGSQAGQAAAPALPLQRGL